MSDDDWALFHKCYTTCYSADADQAILEAYKFKNANSYDGPSEDNVKECYDRCVVCWPLALDLIEQVETSCIKPDPYGFFHPIEDMLYLPLDSLFEQGKLDCSSEWYPDVGPLMDIFGTKCPN